MNKEQRQMEHEDRELPQQAQETAWIKIDKRKRKTDRTRRQRTTSASMRNCLEEDRQDEKK